MKSVEFDGRPLLMGSMTGVRSFKVDSFGRLRAVNNFASGVWRPGENCAVCHRSKTDGAYERVVRSLGGQHLSSSTLRAIAATLPSTVSTSKEPEHHVAQVNCVCGYYAYFDNGSNPHHAEGNVLAVVQGYGTVTVGSRGFRASKAKIVALVDNSESRPTYLQSRNLRFWRHIGLLLLCSLFVALTAATHAWWPFGLNVAGVVSTLVQLIADRKSPVYRRKGCNEPLSSVPDVTRTIYPDVPIFPSLQAALEAFPLVAPPPPSPESDPDFWTRAAS